MQSSTQHRDNSYISLGERRGKSDLARFSLDLSWTSAASDGARIRAYPSPPMSGSPPLPPTRSLDFSDRGHGSYGLAGQDVFRGSQMSQARLTEQSRRPQSMQPYQGSLPSTPYGPSYRIEDHPQQLPYQTQRQNMQQSQQPMYSQQPPPFLAPDRSTMGESPDSSSKAQRKTKGHVASACVPCKRAHLRCDAQRPCSRCLSNGKEDTCVDVQHKKRGRPRLRDEREPRYESLGPNYPSPQDASMTRPISMYGQGNTSMGTSYGDSIQRSSSYRVLKSQGGPAGMAPRYQDHAPTGDANAYFGLMPQTARVMGQESICAYLTMDMQIAKATHGFGETIGIPSALSRKLHDIVSLGDRDKVFRLQRVFEDERREREPNYLPPIYPKIEEDRVIQAIGFGPEEIGQFRAERQELFTFQGPDGQQRTFQIRLGLAKKDSTYFIVVVLSLPATPQSYSQPLSSPYPRDSFPRDSPYGYQTPQQGFALPGPNPFASNPPYGDPRGDVHRTPGPLGPNILPSTNISAFTQAPLRSEYTPVPNPYQTARNDSQQTQVLQRQHDLQLPPIRDQRGEDPMSDPRQRETQTGRVEIGGLLERPGMGRGGI